MSFITIQKSWTVGNCFFSSGSCNKSAWEGIFQTGAQWALAPEMPYDTNPFAFYLVFDIWYSNSWTKYYDFYSVFRFSHHKEVFGIRYLVISENWIVFGIQIRSSKSICHSLDGSVLPGMVINSGITPYPSVHVGFRLCAFNQPLAHAL